MRGVFRNGSHRIEHVAAALGSLVVTIVMTWPLLPNAWDHVLRALYHWDAYTNAMIMGSRVDAALGRGPLSLYDNYFFAPLEQSIVFNENHFGLSLIFLPFYVSSNNPLLAYNLTLLVSFAASVFCTYLLVRRLTNNGYAGFLAGVGFAFCPYVMYEVGRIQLVATQWIPASFLLLHRAFEHRRLRDIAGFWCVYLLQIGTCLYYAMFLIPLLSIVGVALLFRTRAERRFYVGFLIAPVGAAAIALLMVYPYFAERHAFDLERTLAFASSYDGKLSHFTHVHGTNQSLTFLHHPPIIRGALEEVAFPGFTLLALALVAVGSRLIGRLGIRGSLKSAARLVGAAVIVLAFATTATLVCHTMLAGILIAGVSVWWHVRRRGTEAERTGRTESERTGRTEPERAWTDPELYVLVLGVAVLMFLGNAPLHWQGEPVRGLYYYFHTYFPGFNGIRKVSRQAVMVTFVLAVMAGFGAAWVASKLPRKESRWLALGALLLGVCFELRTFPHPLQSAWAGQSVPSAYAFIRTLPQDDVIAVTPQAEGVRIFRWDDGMAYHNYLALYHKHRFANGQSSWAPQVTDLVLRTLLQLPHDEAFRVLWMVGVRHLLVHSDDLPEARRHLPELMAARPAHYRRVFQAGGDHVFTLVPPSEAALGLLTVPALPAQAELVPTNELRLESNLEVVRLEYAVDGNLDTYWSTRKPQSQGQFFGVALSKPHDIVAFEIHNPWHEMFLPPSYTVQAKNGGGAWQTVARQPNLRLYSEQIHTPKAFVFRVVFAQPVTADRIRIVVDKPLPGYDIVVHEIRVFEQL